jgi:hypothetical protein
VRLNISNPSNLVPEIFTICGSGQQSDSDFKVKTSQNRTLGMSFPMTNEWTRHYLTFYYMPSGSTSEMAELNLDWYYLNADDYINHKIQFTMPKLETGDFPTAWQQHESDRIGKPLRGPSAWKEGEVYEGGGANDNYQDLVTYNNSSNMYLCKVTHTAQSSNSPSHSATYGWTESTPWQVTEKRDFIAADVIWSENLKSSMLGAIRADIEDMTVGHLSTSSNQATVDISDGTIKVYGSDKIHPNIVFGVDSNGNAVLSYYQGEQKLYDLGPNQILSQTVDTVPPSFTLRRGNYSRMYISNSSSLTIKNILKSNIGTVNEICFRKGTTTGSNEYGYPHYVFKDGYKQVSNLIKYYWKFSAGISPSDSDLSANATIYDNLAYSNNTEQDSYVTGVSTNTLTKIVLALGPYEITSSNINALKDAFPQLFEFELYNQGAVVAKWHMYLHNCNMSDIVSVPLSEATMTDEWHLYKKVNNKYVQVNPYTTTIHDYVTNFMGGYDYYNSSILD